ncbi:MAG: oligopeptidase A, partial [Gammaproteobacteria bacterium RIFOXYB2_FULL_38_6]
MEKMETRLHHFWSVISHLNNVQNSEDLRKIYEACLPVLSKYSTELSHNEKLYRAVLSIKRTQFSTLDTAQKTIIKHELLGFKLSGVNLPIKKKKKFAALCKKLSKLSNQFSNHVLDATHAWTKHIIDKKLLAGIPAYAVESAKAQAKLKKLNGWVFTLDAPSYIAVMTYADNRKLREEMYFAYTTRATKKFNNTPVMQSILKSRLALAKLLGFKNYAEYSLAVKMVKKTQTVMHFLNDLVKHGLAQAKKEFEAVKSLAEKNNVNNIQAWDVAYYSEKLKKEQFNISDEMFRPYFPETKVVNGLFKIIFKLFHITLKPVKNFDVWDRNVKVYALYQKKNLIGIVYFDLYARSNKRSGAWMDECRTRQLLNQNELQLPIAFVNCNFNPPAGKTPALLSHDEVITLFHEFGHATQHLFTQMKYSAVSGLSGIPWDAVEIASQFL